MKFYILLPHLRIPYMADLSEGCKDHLIKALHDDDPAEKNYHIRQVLQATAADSIDEAAVELKRLGAE
jgi:hypothetical protein